MCLSRPCSAGFDAALVVSVEGLNPGVGDFIYFFYYKRPHEKPELCLKGHINNNLNVSNDNKKEFPLSLAINLIQRIFIASCVSTVLLRYLQHNSALALAFFQQCRNMCLLEVLNLKSYIF